MWLTSKTIVVDSPKVCENIKFSGKTAHFAMFLPIFVQISCLGVRLFIFPYVYSLYNTYKGLKNSNQGSIKRGARAGFWGVVHVPLGYLVGNYGICI